MPKPASQTLLHMHSLTQHIKKGLKQPLFNVNKVAMSLKTATPPSAISEVFTPFFFNNAHLLNSKNA